MPETRHRTFARWLREVTEGAARLLVRLAERLDQAEPPSTGEPSSNQKEAGPAPTGQVPLGGVSSGPPADWLEKVRRGAPHLLRPQHAQATEWPADVAAGPQPDLPPASPVVRAAAEELNVTAVRKRKASVARPPQTSEENVHRPPTFQRKAPVVSAKPPAERRPAPHLLPPSSAIAQNPLPENAAPSREGRTECVPAKKTGEFDQPAPRRRVSERPSQRGEPRTEAVVLRPPTSSTPDQSIPPVHIPASGQEGERPREVSRRIPAPEFIARRFAPSRMGEPKSKVQPERGTAPDPVQFPVRPNPLPESPLIFREAFRAVDPARVPFPEVSSVKPFPEPGASESRLAGRELRDRWPALPPRPALDAVEEVLASWREAERRRYVATEQEGIYGSRRISH